MTNSGNIAYYLHKLWVSFWLRCPNCERGRMFSSFLRLNPTCPNCGVRFERSSGESLGGMMLNLVFGELITFSGFFISEWLFRPPLLFQIVFWVSFNIVFCLAFYRPARALWICVTYLTSGLEKDEGHE